MFMLAHMLIRQAQAQQMKSLLGITPLVKVLPQDLLIPVLVAYIKVTILYRGLLLLTQDLKRTL